MKLSIAVIAVFLTFAIDFEMPLPAQEVKLREAKSAVENRADQNDRKKVVVHVFTDSDDTAVNQVLDFLITQAKIREELSHTTEIAFTDIPLKDGLEYLAQMHRIEIELSPRAVLENPDLKFQPVTLRRADLNLSECLMMLLDPFKLSYFISHGKLIIATPDEVREAGAELPATYSDILAKLGKYPTIPWDDVLRGQYEQADADAISKLEEALADSDTAVQLQAANALFLLRSSATSVPLLKKAVRSDDGKVRRAAYRAVAAIGHENLETLTFLVDECLQGQLALDDMFFLLRQYDDGVCVELEKLFPKVAPEFRRVIIVSLFGRNQDAVRPLILAGLKDDNVIVRGVSLRAWLNVFQSSDLSDDFRAALSALLKDKYAFTRLQAAAILIDKTSDNGQALETLLGLMNDVDPNVKSRALSNFKAISISPSPASIRKLITSLNEILTSGRNELRPAAMIALAAVQTALAPEKNPEVVWGPIRSELQSSIRVNTVKPAEALTIVIQLQIRMAEEEGHIEMKLPESVEGKIRAFSAGTNEFAEMEIQFTDQSAPKFAGLREMVRYKAKLDLTRIAPKKGGKLYLQFLGKNVPISNVIEIEFPEGSGTDR